MHRRWVEENDLRCLHGLMLGEIDWPLCPPRSPTSLLNHHKLHKLHYQSVGTPKTPKKILYLNPVGGPTCHSASSFCSRLQSIIISASGRTCGGGPTAAEDARCADRRCAVAADVQITAVPADGAGEEGGVGAVDGGSMWADGAGEQAAAREAGRFLFLCVSARGGDREAQRVRCLRDSEVGSGGRPAGRPDGRTTKLEIKQQ